LKKGAYADEHQCFWMGKEYMDSWREGGKDRGKDREMDKWMSG
jgi:hypothetical protein